MCKEGPAINMVPYCPPLVVQLAKQLVQQHDLNNYTKRTDVPAVFSQLQEAMTEKRRRDNALGESVEEVDGNPSCATIQDVFTVWADSAWAAHQHVLGHDQHIVQELLTNLTKELQGITWHQFQQKVTASGLVLPDSVKATVVVSPGEFADCMKLLEKQIASKHPDIVWSIELQGSNAATLVLEKITKSFLPPANEEGIADATAATATLASEPPSEASEVYKGKSVAATLDATRMAELSDAMGDGLTALDRNELMVRLQTVVAGYAKSTYLTLKAHEALGELELFDAVEAARASTTSAIQLKIDDAKKAVREAKGRKQSLHYILKRKVPPKKDEELKYWGKVCEWHTGINIKRANMAPIIAITEGAPNFLIDVSGCCNPHLSSFCPASLVGKVPEKKEKKEKKVADTDDEDDGTQKAKKQKHEEVIATHELGWGTANFKIKTASVKDGNPRCMTAKDPAPLPTTILSIHDVS